MKEDVYTSHNGQFMSLERQLWPCYVPSAMGPRRHDIY
jgi:hypothetical protein